MINIHICKNAQSHLTKNYAVDLQCKKQGSDLMSVLSLHCAVLCNKDSWRHRARAASLKPNVKHNWAWSSHRWVTIIARLCTHPKISPESNPMMTLCKSFASRRISWGPPVCIHMQRNHIRTLEIIQSISDCSRFWQHKRNPACTKTI